LRLPSNVVKEAAREAAEVGGKAAGWAEASAKQSDTMLRSAKTAEAAIQKKLAPLGRGIERVADRIEATGLGKRSHSMLDGLIGQRRRASEMAHSKALQKAERALTSEAVGFRKGHHEFFTRTKAPTIDAGELAPVMQALHASKDMSATAKAAHLQQTMMGLEMKMATAGAFEGEVAKRAQKAMKHISKVLGSAQAMENYEKAAGGSFKTMLGVVGKAVGSIKVFHALIGLGAVAGIGAALVSAKGESKQADAAMQDFARDLEGNSSGALLKAAQNAQTNAKRWDIGKTGLKLVSEAADSIMWMNPHGAGLALMSAQMVPMFIEQLVPGNAPLGAYAALKKDDAGEVKLDNSARIQCIKQLSVLNPVVAAHGGEYSRQNRANASEMVERRMTAKQIVQLLADEDAYTKFTAEVAAKQEAQAKAATANDNAALPKAPAPHLAAGMPSTMVAANDLQLDGKVSQTHRQVG